MQESSFQYVLKRPINSGIFLNILTHIMRGLLLFASSSSNSNSMLKITDSRSADVEIPPAAANKVLLVDDSEMIRKTIARQLKKFVQDINECEDGQKGLDEYKRAGKEYMLVMIDYQMPYMNGVTAIEEIRKFEKEHEYSRVTIMCMI